MRYLKTCLVMMVLLMSTAIQSSASVQGPTAVTDGSTVYLPSNDGVCALYTVDGTVTFKAVESGSIPNYKDFGAAFQPANEGDSIMGMYVTNTAYAYQNMLTGEGYGEAAFKPGSYFTLTITGTTASRETKSVEFNLGDYRSSESNRYILDTWEWVDLRPLGKVTKLSFSFSGSESNNYGLLTPCYFAMDDLGCMPDVTEAEVDVSLGENTIDLSNYFIHADNGARERYYLDVEVDDDVMTIAKEGDDNNLTVTGKQQGKRTVLICMTAKGHSQWLQLTVNVNPVTEVTNIDAGREVQSVQYVNAMGQVSDRPFDGVNIIVTRYTDGTVSTVKTIKN